MLCVIVDVSGTTIVVWAVLVAVSTSVVWEMVVLVTVFSTVLWMFLWESVMMSERLCEQDSRHDVRGDCLCYSDSFGGNRLNC